MSEHRVPAEVSRRARLLEVRLKRLWARHDKLERQILVLERKFTDRELRRLGAAGGGK